MICNLKRYCAVVMIIAATTLYGMENTRVLKTSMKTPGKERRWHANLKQVRFGNKKPKEQNAGVVSPADQEKALRDNALEKARELELFMENYKGAEEQRDAVSPGILERFLEGLRACQQAKQEEHSKKLLADIEFLLDHNPDLVKVQKDNGWYPLHKAIQLQVPQVLELFLNRGAAIDEVNEQGRTALYFATNTSEYRSVNILLEREARRDITPSGEESSLGIPDVLERTNSARSLLYSHIESEKKKNPESVEFIKARYPFAFNLYQEKAAEEEKRNLASQQKRKVGPENKAQTTPAKSGAAQGTHTHPRTSKAKRDDSYWYKKALLGGLGVSLVGYIFYKLWYGKTVEQEKAA